MSSLTLTFFFCVCVLSPAYFFTVGLSPGELAALRFGSSLQSLATPSFSYNGVTVLANQNANPLTFSPAFYTADQGSYGIAAGNINGDNMTDLFVTGKEGENLL